MFALGLREELKEYGVTVTTLLPGATDSDFHARAGMGNSAFGAGMKKNSRIEVVRQGFDAMMAGRAEVVGGDRATQRVGIRHRFMPETLKAARHARKARPGGPAPSDRQPLWPTCSWAATRLPSWPPAPGDPPSQESRERPRCGVAAEPETSCGGPRSRPGSCEARAARD